MSDRLDELLGRLPVEAPAADLVGSIIQAVTARRRAQARWRRIGVVAGVCLLMGLALMATSWPDAVLSSVAVPALPDAGALTQAAQDFLAAPQDVLASLANAALTWETILTEGVEAVFLLGVVLLTIGACGGLARLLRRLPLRNGFSL